MPPIFSNPLVIPIEVDKMPEINVDRQLTMESVQTQQMIITESKGNIQHSNNLARLMSLKKYDEPGIIESTAIQGIIGSKA